MIILGICFGYHDASVSLIKNGQVIFCSEEDRFTYLKHDSNFPLHTLTYLLERFNIRPDQIDHVVFGENPYQKFISRFDTFFKHDLFNISQFISLSKKWLGSNLWSIKRIAEFLNISIDKISYIDHHLAHHYSAYYQSNFDNAYSLVLDSIGQDQSLSLYKNDVLVKSISFENSICYLYSLVTNWLGFSPNSSECTTMALSSFGKQLKNNPFSKIVTFKDGDILIDSSVINLKSLNAKAHIKQLEKFLGVSRNSSQKINLSCFNTSNEHFTYADYALAIQEVFEEMIISFINFHCQDDNISNLCISGGGAQNCKLIRKIRENSKFKNIFIPQAPGDAGLALGAALSKSGKIGNDSALNFYLGSYVEIDEVKDVLSSLDSKDISNYSSENNQYSSLEILELTESERAVFLAEQVNNDKIVALVNGQAEFGPRALGARSIICRSDSIELAKKISTQIKKRAPYRPYAISLTEDKAREILVDKNFDSTFYGMQTDALVKSEYHSLVCGAIHIDKTTRPQLTKKGFYHDLISQTKNQIVLNTSLNESGYPLCKSSKEALLLFLKTPIDIILLDNLIVIKK
ncbi:carbamoyltransferase N-terminal domain-containing protein [Bacteriovorax sp. Seq25_V]|uniref:carbamoyltransferase N-terminal domain-containing protein n=1 Tax=Bacteriovorax sp. Seq25_V TaxID=1201288 RepID=UPI00038A489C|nr:carbamoyltransferase N-terminal domain-containing protein [Bacteriovorax sp. Seq25_V]EQC46918.1 carbamoyltransferase [Bacteriovorax sp. Seq25_V]